MLYNTHWNVNKLHLLFMTQGLGRRAQKREVGVGMGAGLEGYGLLICFY